MKKKSSWIGKRRKEREGSRESEDEGEGGGSCSHVIQNDSIEIIHFFWVNDNDDGEGDERIGGMELEWKEELCPKEENDNEIT